MKINYDFIEELNRPDFQPPDWIFNLVWPMLYTVMFVSFYIFLNTKTNRTHMPGIWIFVIQLMLNFLWVPVFFTFRQIKLAFLVALCLSAAVVYMIFIFSKISLLAGLMNVPYLVWLIFADILNFYLCLMNE